MLDFVFKKRQPVKLFFIQLQYKHNNCGDSLNIGSRLDVTSTGHMLDTQRETRKSQPAQPPRTFHAKEQPVYYQNPFSDHDNRNSIQLKGEYLGNVRNVYFINISLQREKPPYANIQSKTIIRTHYEFGYRQPIQNQMLKHWAVRKLFL